MCAPSQPTPYASVNEALTVILAQVQGVLGARFVGMYLSGSLALGDFDPNSSDIDLLVVTDDVLADAAVAALETLHARFDASGSPWAGKVEMVYVARHALRQPSSDNAQYPQVEKGRGFFLDRLEDGWLSQCYIVREYGVTLAGPYPQTLIAAVDPDAMRRMVAQIPEMWLDAAHNDPTWLAWLRTHQNQAFVTLTLCRLLYTLEMGGVASKPAAARWAQARLGEPWAALIQRALAAQHDSGVTPQQDAAETVAQTVAFVEYTVERYRRWQHSS
jgi:hypothetical protein